MAKEPLDPRSLESWEDAFQYTLPAVRAMEKKLRGAVDENQEKLRTLVGASYRDLLGTAQTIVEVREQMSSVEDLLAGIARKSDSRHFGRLGDNYVKLERQARAADETRLAFSARSNVLRSCLSHVSKLLNSGASILVAAKLLLLSRLVFKSLSEDNGDSELVDKIGRRLASQRQRVLRRVDRNLSKEMSDTKALNENLTAFAIATSSTPSDVLRHFQHIRAEAIRFQPMTAKGSMETTALRRVSLFVSTLNESRKIFPDMIGASLRTLSARPILQDPALLALETLGLDTHARWLSSDTRIFTPWTRHDEMPRSRAHEMLSSWAQVALLALTETIATDVASEHSFEAILRARRAVLQMWLSSQGQAREIHAHKALEKLRVPFLKQAKLLIQNEFANSQQAIHQQVTNILQGLVNSSRSLPNKSLWDPALLFMELKDGAPLFRKSIVYAHAGRQEAVLRISATFDDVLQKFQRMNDAIRSEETARWDDDDFEDDDNESEKGVELGSDGLSHGDISQLRSSLRECANDFASGLEASLVAELDDQELSFYGLNAKCPVVLRILREVRKKVPHLTILAGVEVNHAAFADAFIAKLHGILAGKASEEAQVRLQRSIEAFGSSQRSPRALWDGSSLLPVLPTSATFRYLKHLIESMESLGQDLWSPDAVDVLCEQQTEVCARLLDEAGARLEKSLSDTLNRSGAQHTDIQEDSQKLVEEDETPRLEEAGTTGDDGDGKPEARGVVEVDTETTSQRTSNKMVQLLFDASYLQQAFGRARNRDSEKPESGGTKNGLAAVCDSLATRSKLERGAAARVRKSAVDYWRRTYLICGLLAS